MGLFLNSQFCLVGYMSLLRSVACCFDCCILVVSFALGKWYVFQLYSISRVCLGPRTIPLNLRIDPSVSSEKAVGILMRLR